MSEQQANNSTNTSQAADDKKEGAEHINLKVVGNDHNEVFFKIKRTTQLKKLMEAYCERQGKAMASVRFLYDGERIQAHHTPAELDMEDGDAIDVMVEQLGGAVSF
ncbi:2313_t:CDS:2 [Paraglomus brasilianum]|uniref:2313_t:CDS:1 n=1 Tax=Paraglomus brasilianum TaxID=144538 RepID=A0A9N9EVR6_9GLOM|nr:2313_t:CDS:2 [Paraglomus brasilianum]